MEKVDIKVKIEVKEQKRVSLKTFFSVSEKIVEFFKGIENFTGVNVNLDEWSIGDFRNGSVQYSMHGLIEDEKSANYLETLDETMSIIKSHASISKHVPPALYNTYFGIMDYVPANGKVKISTLRYNGQKRPNAKRFVLSQETVARAREIINKDSSTLLSGELHYWGEIKGVIYSWQKEGRKPQLEIQEYDTGERIKCYYDDDMYNDIYSILDDKSNVVFITGMVVMNKKDNKIISIKASKFSVDRAKGLYKEGDLDKFFGCAPGLTGDMSAREYIDGIRDEAE